MTAISEIGEFSLIERIFAGGAVPSDDCAAIGQRSGLSTLVSTDMLMEDRHFIRADIDPFDLGWKAAAVNLSDIAASGGRPTGLLLSLSLPSDLPVQWVERFAEGLRSAGVPLLGGDTIGSPGPICINVTALGECPEGKQMTRGGAGPSDLLCVTGPLGDSAGGLHAIRHGRKGDCPAALLRAHYHPLPRLKEGVLLASTPGVTSMMDISDGLASDIPHLLRPGLGADVDTSSIPVSADLRSYAAEDAIKYAVGGGEDYELLFTMRPECRPEVSFSVIGRITAAHEGIVWKGGGAEAVAFDHFNP